MLMSCKHISYVECDEEEEFVHNCPQAGHGVCPICFDPQTYLNEEIVSID